MYYISLILQKTIVEYSKSPHAQRSTGIPVGVFNTIFIVMLVLIVLIALILCIKYFIYPGEKNQNHIKYSILQDNIDKNLENDE